ncbi:Na(+)-translocating NADH-quinone reductase subunit A [bacterium]|nr:Na(+)-translocating NADH-quinone reductase subunit A [bacterium]
MGKTIKLKRGHDIILEGGAIKVLGETPQIATYALKPANNFGIKPKLMVKTGAEVKAGTPLFYDKNNESALFCAPVSGEVVDIVRGEKRKLLEIRILADKEISYENLGTKTEISALDREAVVAGLLKSGAWPMLRMRPFAKVAKPGDTPKAIFISGFDSAPLAPDYNFIMQGKAEAFQNGLDVLKLLTDGPIHLNLRGGEHSCDAFEKAEGVVKNHFYGPHPSGTIGVQIHHIDPIRKGESVWYINPQDVITIGKVFTEGIFDPQRTIAVTGAEFGVRKYYETRLGCNIEPFVKDNLTGSGHTRFVSGSPLLGDKIEPNGFLSFWDCQLTSIHERDYPEFQGWLMPSYKRPTASLAFPWSMEKDTKFVANTSTHGEQRSFIVTGQYEKVLPMDIYPVYLLKAIMAKDIENMEGLGIYEVAEDEMAICEFVCTSKQPVTDWIRFGLDMIEKEG